MVADRHGRAYRADNDPRRRPAGGYRTHGRRFRRAIEDAIATLPPDLGDPVRDARLVIEDVPPDPALHRGDQLVLATFANGVLTVYRRPVEHRAESRPELEDVLLVAVAEAVARSLGYEGDIDDWLD